MNQRGFSSILFFIIVAAVLVTGYFAYNRTNKTTQTEPPKQVACTLDAKVCSDGTSVGRVAPKCDFAPCPTYSGSMVNGIYTNKVLGISFKYPEKWEVGKNPSYDQNFKNISLTKDIGGPNHQIIFIEFNEHPAQVDIDDYVKNSLGGSVRSYPTFSLDGQIAKKFLLTGQCTNPDESVFIQKNSSIYQITWSGCRGTDATRADFDQILSTFKFTQ